MRYPNKFYDELRELRKQYGTKEYDRADIRSGVVALLQKHGIKGDDLFDTAADQVLDRVERKEDDPSGEGQGDLFAGDQHVALGDRKRIRRDCMNREQLIRRERIIDDNHIAQNTSWTKEKRWLRERIDMLDGHAPDTIWTSAMSSQIAAE